MYLWMLIWLMTLSNVNSHWESCKIQCDNNFKRDDITEQASLISFCKRGCDLLTVALDSRSNPLNTLIDRVVHPKDQPLVVNQNDIEVKYLRPIVNNEMQMKQTSEKLQRPSTTHGDATVSSSKTTVEPTSQPVQDHPAEASKETTTTKGPKKIQNKVSTKMLPDRVEQNLITNGRLEQAKHSCRHECVTAYRGPVEQEACVVGCHLQATTASLNSRKEMIKEESPKSTLGIFKNVFFKFANHIGRLVHITSSWASSSRKNRDEIQENKVQVYGSEDLTRRVQLPMFVNLRQTYNIPDVIRRSEIIKLEQKQNTKIIDNGFFHFVLQPHLAHERISSRHDNLPHIITIIKEETRQTSILRKESNVKGTKEKSTIDTKERDQKEGEVKDQQHQLDLLECISRKSGLPRWIIAIAIFASALVVLWLCFSLTAPPDDIKIVKTKPPECAGPLDFDDDDDYDDDMLTCSEKKKLLARNDDIIKIRIENV